VNPKSKKKKEILFKIHRLIQKSQKIYFFKDSCAIDTTGSDGGDQEGVNQKETYADIDRYVLDYELLK
jgi:hypothetical protein